jgi:hypothetical protein
VSRPSTREWQNVLHMNMIVGRHAVGILTLLVAWHCRVSSANTVLCNCLCVHDVPALLGLGLIE